LEDEIPILEPALGMVIIWVTLLDRLGELVERKYLVEITGTFFAEKWQSLLRGADFWIGIPDQL